MTSDEVLISELIKGGAGKNEVQTVLVANAVGGTFILTFGGQKTGPIAHDASAVAVETALKALSNITDVNVTRTETPEGNVSFAVTFVEPSGDVALMTADYTDLVTNPNGSGHHHHPVHLLRHDHRAGRLR
jgi:hypothetical protein